MQRIYINNLTWYIFLGILVLFALSYILPIHNAVWLVFYLFLGLTAIDFILLFATNQRFAGSRQAPEKLSNGDENPITIRLESGYGFPVTVTVIDELPFQFQERNFKVKRTITPAGNTAFEYVLRPFERGEYFFGRLNVYVSSPLRLVSRRFIFGEGQMMPVYPSYIQMRKYDLMAFSNRLFEYGIKKIRRIGHTMEFEQIKEYVSGDDIRTINWKATAKKNQLMVNQFQDERSQNVYMAIDKGRVMKMPFNGLSLLDYAINATLVLANTIIKKNDKAGMFAFSRRVENRVAADRRSGQMQKIQETLYNIKTDFFETDYGRLYADIKRNITHRSLILLYTNFETMDGLKRQLPYLKGIAKSHLLVVIFFENTELDTLIHKKANSVQEIYDQVIAEKFAFEKRLIVQELKKYGIHSVLTKPEHLTLDTINKYLEIKARGIL
ncbi:cell division protein FtsB [Flavobacterium akiainvivens]|uniref:Cell division protein FtsB n=1 Tax=Flavobacterium akiainvivens TaxID=1202724 RepID=A0A0M8MGJ6_9FLAO|nr:cell division protein FtsB [Flavobacterium akiainvivens]